jgi:hypothetical protein
MAPPAGCWRRYQRSDLILPIKARWPPGTRFHYLAGRMMSAANRNHAANRQIAKWESKSLRILTSLAIRPLLRAQLFFSHVGVQRTEGGCRHACRDHCHRDADVVADFADQATGAAMPGFGSSWAGRPLSTSSLSLAHNCQADPLVRSPRPSGPGGLDPAQGSSAAAPLAAVALGCRISAPTCHFFYPTTCLWKRLVSITVWSSDRRK